jgi:hypothetical protein
MLLVESPPASPWQFGWDQVTALVQAVALIAAGVWALVIYWRSRQGQVTLSVVPKARPYGLATGEATIVVDLTITNSSRVVWHHQRSTVTLMDASSRVPKGDVLLAPFARVDPFLAVYGSMSDDINEVAEGNLFYYKPGQEIILEPSEAVQTAVAFPLDMDRTGLLALHVRLQGRGSWSRKNWVWSSFFFIEADSGQDLGRIPLPPKDATVRVQHAENEAEEPSRRDES